MLDSDHDSLRNCQRYSRSASWIVPLNADLFQFGVTMLSFKIFSATRAASRLRSANTPARLATRIACKATGITMAMKSSAASTSASVKALTPGPRRDALRRLIAHFITQPVCRQADPQRAAIAIHQLKTFRAAGADAAVRLEPDVRQRRMFA